MKATLFLETAIEKVVQSATILAAIVWVLNPYIVKASSLQSTGEATQVFEVKNLPNQNTDLSQSNNTSLAYADIMANDLDYQTTQSYKELMRDYLAKRNSPLADCVDLLVQLKTSDKILSLANAESGLGKHYIHDKNNLWGVGGGTWKMGNNVCEGVASMDNFLNAYPRNSTVKYAEMSFDRMNGLYKQPRAAHWELNNAKVYNALQLMKTQARTLAQAKISTPVVAVTVDTQLLKR